MQPLGWFRSNNAGGTWLAFFALACQLVLTFGHVHFARVGVLSAGFASTASPATDSASTPASPARPDGLAQDFCAVCSNIALANTLLLPEQPHSVTPVSISACLPPPPAAVGVASQNHFHFGARGPPSA